MTNDYRDMVRLKLSNVAKNRNLQEVEVEESEPDRNFPVIVTVISSSFVKNALNHSLNQAVLKHT